MARSLPHLQVRCRPIVAATGRRIGQPARRADNFILAGFRILSKSYGPPAACKAATGDTRTARTVRSPDGAGHHVSEVEPRLQSADALFDEAHCSKPVRGSFPLELWTRNVPHCVQKLLRLSQQVL